MKNVIRFSGIAVLIAAVGFTIYFLVILNSKGNESISFIEPEVEYESFYQLINEPELRNKVIYVDFWHTGCKPCLVEFQSLPEFKSNFMNDDIAFLYLGKDRSVPGEKFRWKNMILDKNITGYHYFISNDQFFKFWSEAVKDTTINPRFPHHLIINRKGEIVDDNAPKASSKNTVRVLKAEL